MEGRDGTVELVVGAILLSGGVTFYLVFGPGLLSCGGIIFGPILLIFGLLKTDRRPVLPMNLPPPYPPLPRPPRLGPRGWLSGKACPRCDSSNPPNAMFCIACGAPF